MQVLPLCHPFFNLPFLYFRLIRLCHLESGPLSEAGWSVVDDGYKGGIEATTILVCATEVASMLVISRVDSSS